MPVRLRALLVCVLAWATMPGLQGQQPASVPPRGGAIEGSIVDDSLTPLAGVTVTLDRSGKLMVSHQTDASGWFRFERLEPDSYQLAATLAGYRSTSKRATVRSVTSVLQIGLALPRDGASLPIAESPSRAIATAAPLRATPVNRGPAGTITGTVRDPSGSPLPGVTVTVSGGGISQPLIRITQVSGQYEFTTVPAGTHAMTFELWGFKKVVRPNVVTTSAIGIAIDQAMEVGQMSLEMTVSAATPVIDTKKTSTGAATGQQLGAANVQWNLEGGSRDGWQIVEMPGRRPQPDSSSYAHLDPNGFKLTSDDPVSTFGADVDTASYTNVRRFLSQGHLPPADAVRVEEFVNYFMFDYPAPDARRPVGITSETGPCPWAPGHKLVLLGARAQAVEAAGPRNLVFLIDVSGSMSPAARLPLIKTALRLFVDTLQPDDEISIVTYAGTSGVALPPTIARHRDRIQDAIDALQAGGSTNGGAGLMLAYRLAREEFVPGGVNRIVLATDGDFNVGVVGPLDLQHLVERERRSGVFLSVLGVGDDNFKDATMEMLADKGNGHYAYLDSLQEAQRVLIREGRSTLETVAKDVKFQVEFNPTAVQAWRLIGYEDRLMAHQDFNDDRKDGGELGAGHTVTVLYEVVPAGAAMPPTVAGAGQPAVDPLIYQSARGTTRAARADEWLTVKVRYKLPEGAESELLTTVVRTGAPGGRLPFAAAVAEFALLLRDDHPLTARWDALINRLHALGATDPDGERLGFVHVVELAAGLQRLR